VGPIDVDVDAEPSTVLQPVLATDRAETSRTDLACRTFVAARTTVRAVAQHVDARTVTIGAPNLTGSDARVARADLTWIA